MAPDKRAPDKRAPDKRAPDKRAPEEFIGALEPVVTALSGSIVDPGDAQDGDVPVEWGGDVVCFVRTDELHGALDRLVSQVERQLGSKLADLDREQKQLAIGRLVEQGAFLLRGSVEDVAALMGVSRVTLYTYINAIESAAD